MTGTPTVGLGDRALVKVGPVATRTSPVWSRLVSSRPSDVFHSPAWHAVLHDTYGFEPTGHVLQNAAGEAVAGIVSCQIDGITGRRQVSLPFSDFSDPLVDNLEEWRELIEGLPKGPPLRLRCVHNQVPLHDPTFRTVGTAHWHAVDVSRPVEELWESFKGSARRNVRIAEKAGVSIRSGSSEADLRAFFSLHLSVRKHKYGYLAQPYRFFQAIKRHFLDEGNGTILLAELDGLPIAAFVLLTWRERTYYKFGASGGATLDRRPNDLLMWQAARYANEQGSSRLDLGLSDDDQEGLIRFKDKYASERGRVTFLERPGTSTDGPAIDETRELLSKLTKLLTAEDVPDRVTEHAGDILYRYFT